VIVDALGKGKFTASNASKIEDDAYAYCGIFSLSIDKWPTIEVDRAKFSGI